MRSIGAVEARTRFGALLDAAARGEEVVITRHGRAMARLVPVAGQGRAAAEAAAARILERSRGVTVGGLSIKELIGGGRT